MADVRVLARAVFAVTLLLLSGAVGTAFGQNVFVILVPNQGSANVSSYIINESSGGSGGTLTGAAGSPYVLGAGAGAGDPVRTAVTNPDHKFLYTANNNGTISLFKINPDGSLTPVSTPVAITSASGIAIDNSGSPKRLYVANKQTGFDTQIYGFSIDPSSGNLTPLAGSPYAVTAGQQGAQSMLVVGGFLYVVESVNNDIQVMAIQPSGALVAGATVASQFSPGEDPLDIKTDGAGHIYVTDFLGFGPTPGPATPGVAAFSISGATLVPIAAYNSGDNPQEITVVNTSSGNNFLYVANSNALNGGTASVAIYQINANGTLQAPTLVTGTVGIQPTGAAVDLSNQFLHVTDGLGNVVLAYAINQSTGALTARGSFPTGTSPYFLWSTIAPAPASVPASSTWSLFALGILLAGISFAVVRANRRPQAE